MTDSQNSAQQSASAPPPANSAGALLRQYREAKGLHISILAAALKVPSSKLVALEANRLEELPDLVFARALARARANTRSGNSSKRLASSATNLDEGTFSAAARMEICNPLASRYWRNKAPALLAGGGAEALCWAEF